MKLAVPGKRHALFGPRGLLRDRRGNSALEFAFVAFPFFGLIIAILQITLTFFAQQVIETAGDKAVRRLVTGQAQKANMTAAQFKTLVCSNLPSFMKCSNVMIDVRNATDFSTADTAAPTITYDGSGNPNNVWSFAPGGGGEITVARVMYVWSVQSGPLGLDLATMTGSRRLLISTNVFKTEPYA